MVDELVEFAVEPSPCDARGLRRCDLGRQVEVARGEAWGEHAPVGFGERHCHPAAVGGQLVADGAGNPGRSVLCAEAGVGHSEPP